MDIINNSCLKQLIGYLMSKLHKTKIPLYDLDLIFTQDKLKVEKLLSTSLDTAAGWCVWNDDTIAICVPNTGNPNKVIATLAHECYHAAMVVASTTGLSTAHRADEAVAYIISWLVEYCLKCMDKDSVITCKKSTSTV